jgi:hypothetical protein
MPVFCCRAIVSRGNVVGNERKKTGDILTQYNFKDLHSILSVPLLLLELFSLM